MRRKKFYYYISALILIFVVAFYFYQDKDVVYTEPKWDCKYLLNKWECRIAFNLINETYTEQFRKVSIKAINIPANSKYSSLKINGEKILEISLQPKENKMIHETMTVKGKPNKINIAVWK